MNKFALSLLAFLGVFQVSSSTIFEVSLPTNEQLMQYNNFVSVGENNDPRLDFKDLDIPGIIDTINQIFGSIANASQPIHQSEISIVLPTGSLLPIAGVVKLNDLLMDYYNFYGAFEVELLLGIIPRSARLQLSFDRFFLKTSYENYFRLGFDVPDYVPNNGKIETTIENFALDLNITKLDLGEYQNMIQGLTMSLVIDNIKLNLEGVINDEKVGNGISDLLNDLVEQLKEHPDETNKELGTAIKELLNTIIYELFKALTGN